MAWVTDDYICTNEKCSMFEKRVEYFGSREERDTYRCGGHIISDASEAVEPGSSVRVAPLSCGALLKRMPALSCKHISWSTWRV